MNIKMISAVIAASLLVGAPVSALAAPAHTSTAPAAHCKDAKGKFIKCPTAASSSASKSATTSMTMTMPMTAAKPVQCKDAKGKFIKCPTAPAKPKTCRDPKTGKFGKC